MLINDLQIKNLALNHELLSPFSPELVRRIGATPAISFGLSSFGYDLRLSEEEFLVFHKSSFEEIDPKAFTQDKGLFNRAALKGDRSGDYFILPGNSYGLGVSLERFKMPDNLTGLAIGKSTYARCGIIANLTPIEAGWEGHLTLEFSNSSPNPCRLYVNEGIVQVLFFQGETPGTTYRDRKGKYQGQEHKVTLPRA